MKILNNQIIVQVYSLEPIVLFKVQCRCDDLFWPRYFYKVLYLCRAGVVPFDMSYNLINQSSNPCVS